MPEYEVEIATDSGFGKVIDRDHVAAVITRYVPAKPLALGRYWWRVRGRDFPGRRTAWSNPISFTVSLPKREFKVPAGSSFEQIQGIISKAAAQSPARVVFTKGEYRLDPRKAEAFILLQGAGNLIIDGNGSTIVFTDKTSFVNLKDCADIHITGFFVDYANMPHAAGKVIAVNRKSQTIDLELLPGYPRFEDDKGIAESNGGMVRNSDDLAMKNGQPLVVNTEGSFKHLTGRTYRLKASTRKDFAAFAVGDLYIKGPRGPAGYSILNSPDIVLSNNTMYMCTGIGFATTGAARLRIIKCNLQRKDGRPIAVQNGGHNHHDGRLGPWVENCLFENNEIRDYPCRAMIVRHSQDIVIRNNRISNAKFKTFRNTAAVVDLDGCRRLTFKGNRIDDCRQTPEGAVRAMGCTKLSQ